MRNSSQHIQFAVCLDNEGYKASLEVGKLYRVVPDREAEANDLIRIVDESGDDYAFAANRFQIVKLPLNVEKALIAAARL
jgi:hypothetical protein